MKTITTYILISVAEDEKFLKVYKELDKNPPIQVNVCLCNKKLQCKDKNRRKKI